jgi:hypothetical protein
LAHQKTIEAYKAAGVDWKDMEKGHEMATRSKKELVEKDQNKVVKVTSVYRVKIDDNEEVILFDKTTTGKTGLGNPVTYYELPDDLCVWYEPQVITQIEFNPKTEQNEMVTKVGDLSEVKPHYLYRV